jgi:hypothetical protein
MIKDSHHVTNQHQSELRKFPKNLKFQTNYNKVINLDFLI